MSLSETVELMQVFIWCIHFVPHILMSKFAPRYILYYYMARTDVVHLIHGCLASQ